MSLDPSAPLLPKFVLNCSNLRHETGGTNARRASPLLGFLVRRQPAFGRELVDEVGQALR
jgi:hypothetical protein